MSKARELAELSRTVSDSADAVAITIDSSENVTFSEDIKLGDGKKAIFGAGSDLQIYHDGSDSYVQDDGTGDLIIKGANVEIQTGAGNKYFQGAANVARLYHTNNEKLATTGSGIDVTGTVTSDGLTVDGSATFTTTGNTSGFILKSTDNDSAVGPRFDLTRSSSSPADGDAAGQIRFMGNNDAGTETSFGFIRMFLSDVSDGAEAGRLEIDTRVNGTNRTRLKMSSTETVFNEDSVDLDFRVESNNKQGMFIVDGADDVIKVGGITGGADGTLKVKSNSSHLAIAIEENSGNEAYSLGVVADGSLIFANSGTEVVRFDDSGNLLVGGTSVGAENSTSIASTGDMQISRASGSGRNHIIFKNGGSEVGSISTNTSATTYATSSDYRLKENVVAMSGATDRLKQLKPSRFNFIADADVTVDGFLAHEVADVVPEAITGTKDAVDSDGNPDYQGIDQSKLVPLLVATIQELEARLTALENS